MKAINKKLSFRSSTETNLTTIKCECGAEILLIPDTREMGRAIEGHAEKHRKMEQNPAEKNSAFERIQNLLLKQVLEKAAQKGS